MAICRYGHRCAG